jgi:hypothetical protein
MSESRPGKIPTTSVRRRISLFSRSLGVVRPDLAPDLVRIAGEGQQLLAGRLQMRRRVGVLHRERVDDPVELRCHGVGVGLVEDRAHLSGHVWLRAFGDAREQVAQVICCFAAVSTISGTHTVDAAADSGRDGVAGRSGWRWRGQWRPDRQERTEGVCRGRCTAPGVVVNGPEDDVLDWEAVDCGSSDKSLPSPSRPTLHTPTEINFTQRGAEDRTVPSARAVVEEMFAAASRNDVEAQAACGDGPEWFDTPVARSGKVVCGSCRVMRQSSSPE